MKRQIFLGAIASLLMASCSNELDVRMNQTNGDVSPLQINVVANPISKALVAGSNFTGTAQIGVKLVDGSGSTYDGKTYSLSSFGICTSTDYTEGGQYHIYGDSEDSVYADKTDKLKSALEEDPDAVVNVLSSIFGNLRKTMSDKMSASKVSSTQSFYSDIKMKDDIKDYEKQIKEFEDKLADMEDAYYAKFTAMETALAKIQSQQSSLAGLLGG